MEKQEIVILKKNPHDFPKPRELTLSRRVPSNERQAASAFIEGAFACSISTIETFEQSQSSDQMY